jgi:DNA polymerase-1
MTPVLANTPDLVEQCLQEISNSKVNFVDVETSGLKAKNNHIVGYVLKAVEAPRSFYIPVRHAGGGNFPGCSVPVTAEGWRGDLHPVEMRLAKIAKADPTRRWVGHNLIFDLEFCDKFGISFEGDLEDTQINAALIDTNMRSFALEAVARYMEVTAKKGDDLYAYIGTMMDCPPDRKSMEHFWRTNAAEPVVWEYAAGDDITTEEVWAEQQKVLDEEELRRVWGVECRLIRTLLRMKLRGVRIDEDALQRVHNGFIGRANELRATFPSGFNSSAPTQLKELLKHRIDDNWPRGEITPTILKRSIKLGIPAIGALKFDEATLKRVPEGRAILEQRKIEHAASTFTGPMIERHLVNGRVYCSFNQMRRDDFGTITGRLSSSDPNLQQVPKRDKMIGPAYRTIFLPEEGHYWDTNDYKSQEYVVFTDYTRIPMLVDGYNQEPPIDIHQNVANVLIEAGFTWVRRDPEAKRINLGVLYGMGVDKLAASLDCKAVEARAIMDTINRMLPAIKGTPTNPGFMRKAEKRAKRRGYVHTYLGRRQRFPDSNFAHKAGNAIIQGSSADITKLKMVEVDDFFHSEGDEAYLMLQVHDSMDWSVPVGKERLADEARRIMTSFGENDLITMGVPMRVDSGKGPNWSIATYG